MMKLPQIKQSEKEISAKAPWRDDKLKRRECAETLTRLLEGQEEPLTISINGEWGSGKTFMLRRWRQDLEKKGYTAIYFNAWEDDFIADPLIAIIGQLWIALEGKKYDTEITGKLLPDIKESIMPFLKQNWKKASWLMASGVIKHLSGIDADKLKELEKTAEYSIFEDYIEIAQSRNHLRSKLTALANTIYNSPPKDKSGKPLKDEKGKELEAQKPLVFIIDELDRCRPTFAIELLERVKHLFDIKHMVFVLGIDREQLGKSIQSVYGDIVIEKYLHRFIDLDFIIPAFNRNSFFDHLWEQYQIDKYWDTVHSNTIDKGELTARLRDMRANVHDLICNLNLSLREIEQTLKQFCFVLHTFSTSLNSPILTAILIILKIKNKDLYEKFVNGATDFFTITEFLIPPTTEMETDNIALIELTIYRSMISNNIANDTEQQRLIRKVLDALRMGNEIPESDILPHRLKKSIDAPQLDYALVCYCDAAKKIHLLEENASIEGVRAISGKLELAPLALGNEDL